MKPIRPCGQPWLSLLTAILLSYGNNSTPSTGFTNCGLFNESRGQIIAQHNFWGAVSGPGPDYADGVCAVGGSTIIFTPFAADEFNIK